MQADHLQADYVIVGAGAVGMAFADELLSVSDANMIVVDRRHRPGGTGTTPIRSCVFMGPHPSTA